LQFCQLNNFKNKKRSMNKPQTFCYAVCFTMIEIQFPFSKRVVKFSHTLITKICGGIESLSLKPDLSRITGLVRARNEPDAVPIFCFKLMTNQ